MFADDYNEAEAIFEKIEYSCFMLRMFAHDYNEAEAISEKIFKVHVVIFRSQAINGSPFLCKIM